jgi:(2Fe-2S) ferredoxin
MFSLDRVACFGACALAPVVVINNKVYGGMSPIKMEKMIDAFEKQGPTGYSGIPGMENLTDGAESETRTGASA